MSDRTYTIELLPNKREGIYRLGDTIKFYPNVTADSRIVVAGEVKWKLYKNNTVLFDEGTCALGVLGACVSFQAEEIGFYRCEVIFEPDDADEVIAKAGVGVEPEKIERVWAIPDDFDHFWERQKARLADMPMHCELERLEAVGIKAFDVTIDCVDETAVRGLLLTPERAEDGSCPAILTLQGAGVRSARSNELQHFVDKGFVAMDINAHGIENFQDYEYYADLAENRLAAYQTRGFFDETPDSIYFVNMFLRVKRAIEFLTSRPEWDGENLFLIGGSQGAFQTFAGAYLDDRVTAIATGVPAGSNIAGGGWPFAGEALDNLSEEKRLAVFRNAPYVDNVSFASKLTIPCYMTVGFIDAACRPDGVYSVYNAYQGPKRIWCGPMMPHVQDPWLWGQCLENLMNHIKR